MKSKLALLALSMILAFTFSVVAQEKPQETAAPKAVVAEQDHYFGAVKTGTPISYSFVIKNTGKTDLEIKSVAPGCGCTTSDYDKVIAPGKEGKITLEVKHTEGYKGDVTKNATVTTNDPALPSFQLILRANFIGE
jgi:hypothetical protein